MVLNIYSAFFCCHHISQIKYAASSLTPLKIANSKTLLILDSLAYADIEGETNFGFTKIKIHIISAQLKKWQLDQQVHVWLFSVIFHEDMHSEEF